LKDSKIIFLAARNGLAFTVSDVEFANLLLTSPYLGGGGGANVIIFFIEILVLGTDCYDFKNIFAKKITKILAFFAQTTSIFCNNLIISLVLVKNANFSPNIGKNSRK
jgi:hypothetical protein